MMNTEAHKKTASLALLHGVHEYMVSRLCLMPKRKATTQTGLGRRQEIEILQTHRRIPSYVLVTFLLLQAIEVSLIRATTLH